MAIDLTCHGRSLPRAAGTTERVEVLGPQIGAAVAVNNGSTFTATKTGLYRIVATGDCRVQVSIADAVAALGEIWYAKSEGVRYLQAGQLIRVAAL